MNATQHRPGTHLFTEGHLRLISRLDAIQDMAQPGFGPSPRAELEGAIAALEKLLPALGQHLATQSLLSQDWDTVGRQRMEEQLNQSRSKLRELQVLCESARRLLNDGESDAVVEALNAYLVPSLEDMKDALRAQSEIRSGTTS